MQSSVWGCPWEREKPSVGSGFTLLFPCLSSWRVWEFEIWSWRPHGRGYILWEAGGGCPVPRKAVAAALLCHSWAKQIIFFKSCCHCHFVQQMQFLAPLITSQSNRCGKGLKYVERQVALPPTLIFALIHCIALVPCSSLRFSCSFCSFSSLWSFLSVYVKSLAISQTMCLCKRIGSNKWKKVLHSKNKMKF